MSTAAANRDQQPTSQQGPRPMQAVRLRFVAIADGEPVGQHADMYVYDVTLDQLMGEVCERLRHATGLVFSKPERAPSRPPEALPDAAASGGV